jgi:hypothetical protein
VDSDVIAAARSLIARPWAEAYAVAERGAANVRRLGMIDKAEWWERVATAAKEIEAATRRG